MNNVTPLIDMTKDIWVFPSSDDLSDYTFQFAFLPNDWFKKTVKKITKESISIGRLKVSSLHRYNYSLVHFFKFCEDYNFNLDTFADITFDIIEGFIHYMLANIDSPQTRSVVLASLKHHIKHGQLFDWDGFPISEIFDGTERRTLQSEDSLKTMLIDDVAMENIDKTLVEMKLKLEPKIEHLNGVLLWSLITIIRHTGIRLSEALELDKNCIKKDLLKKPLLFVNSGKNETERFIPIDKIVTDAIKFLVETTEKIRVSLNTDKLFYCQTKRAKYIPIKQVTARDWLKTRFTSQYRIKDSNGQQIALTYHQFRHQIGTDMLNNGMSMFEVKQYLGHESLHSTRLYARVRNDKLTKEYKKIGFIGLIEAKVDDVVDENGEKLDMEKRLMTQLPDGVCQKPINKKVANCKRPNACLSCKKFITTPEFLDIHKNHLERIRADKERYQAEDLFGNEYMLLETEKILVEIITRLEALNEEVAK